jgi:hypothetical protein
MVKEKTLPWPGRGVDADAAAVLLHDRAADGQARAGAATILVMLSTARSQRAVFFRRRCSLSLIISLKSPTGRISKVLPYVSAGCRPMSCTA